MPCLCRVILRTVWSRCCQNGLPHFSVSGCYYGLFAKSPSQCVLNNLSLLLCMTSSMFSLSYTLCIFSYIFSAVPLLHSSEVRALCYLPYCLVANFSHNETSLYSQSSHFYLWLTKSSNWAVWDYKLANKCKQFVSTAVT